MPKARRPSMISLINGSSWWYKGKQVSLKCYGHITDHRGGTPSPKFVSRVSKTDLTPLDDRSPCDFPSTSTALPRLRRESCVHFILLQANMKLESSRHCPRHQQKDKILPKFSVFLSWRTRCAQIPLLLQQRLSVQSWFQYCELFYIYVGKQPNFSGVSICCCKRSHKICHYGILR